VTTSPYPTLFSPFRLGHVEARNRIVSTSHGTNLAEGGAPSDRLIAYHAAKAEGGCGTVMMFGSGAAWAMSPIPNNHVNTWTDSAVLGPKLANALSGAGHDIEIVTRQYSLGEDIGTTVRAVLTERLLRKRVRITGLTAMVDGARTGRAI